MKTIKEMKAKLQAKKQDNKGFSLVELIIVIAIMAILVGIIASQVIPYMEKSRESKDISFLDTCLTSFQTAYAENECTISTLGKSLAQMDGGSDEEKALAKSIRELVGLNTSDTIQGKMASNKGKSAVGPAGDATFNIVTNGNQKILGVSCGGLGVSTSGNASK